ncbi:MULTISPECIES: TetR/AcrR family transcriptional regulator [Paenibacillus]|uniref:TetR family transcriptional regulator n=1 Tax=Paenibacillus albilobatus TaxID=2716884 RepID=A0A920CE72_9BACL|nr:MULTISPECIES: TetR/AcrR family transcriptional regulator [Paenibacillus]GIO33477.1 TetR family transcriptional regulator [Paenibacillus albilobatus]
MDDENKVTDKQNGTKSRLIQKLLHYVRKNGFQSLRMEEIAKMMDVSRATLYKYFSSKEEVIAHLVNFYVDYINDLMADSSDNDDKFGIRFQKLFEQSVLVVEYITNVFLTELESNYPEMYDRLRETLEQREQQWLAFINEGIQEGIFNEINGKLFIMQDEILRNLFDVKYLMVNNLTVHQVLHDFYKLKKIQLFKPEKLQAVDDTKMMSRMEGMAHKITKNLYL